MKVGKRDIYLILSGMFSGWVLLFGILFIIYFNMITFGLLIGDIMIAFYLANKVDKMELEKNNGERKNA